MAYPEIPSVDEVCVKTRGDTHFVRFQDCNRFFVKLPATETGVLIKGAGYFNGLWSMAVPGDVIEVRTAANPPLVFMLKVASNSAGVVVVAGMDTLP